MQNAASLLFLTSTLLPTLSVAIGGVLVYNSCNIPIWINDVAPSANQYDAWSEIAPDSIFRASNPPAAGAAGITAKIGLQNGTTDILQLEVAMTADGSTFHYDVSSVDGNPFFTMGRHVGCLPNAQNYDSQYCAPSETGNQCGKQEAGNPWRVMSAPSDCGDILLELCAGDSEEDWKFVW